MKILLVTPAPPGSLKGNRITALRWARLLRQLGHRVTIEQKYHRTRCDVLVALHARRSARSITRFAREHPELPLVVALTGTDLYRDIKTSAVAKRSLKLATRLIVLQPAGIAELPEHLRSKAQVIYQSVELPRGLRRKPPAVSGQRSAASTPHSALRTPHSFRVCVLGHLRSVKDPFRAARASRLLPASSRIEIVQVGAALSRDMARRARAEQAANPRYRWLGELPRARAFCTLAGSQLLVLSSKMEGGANVVGEAIALGVPVISSRISGSIGLLGPDYPGYFEFGDTRALAALLSRAETDTAFCGSLAAWCRQRRTLFDPAAERDAWGGLLRELQSRGNNRGWRG